MTSNHVAVSADGMEMIIRDQDGRRATLRSARPQGFTASDVENARTFTLSQGLIPGQVNRARRLRLFGRTLYVHVNTGPPTWWLPRLRVRRREVMVGWLRGLIAFSWEVSRD